MKIRMITMQATPEGARVPGEVYDAPEDMAMELIRGGYAQAMEAMPTQANGDAPSEVDKTGIEQARDAAQTKGKSAQGTKRQAKSRQ